MAEKILLGAHMSAAGGVHNALLDGKRIGATTIQLFTANQKRWLAAPLLEEEVVKWKDALKETGLTHIMSHDSYLINLGCPDLSNLIKSRKTFREEIERCLRLGITYLNFHPGSYLKDTQENCLNRIIESLLENEDLVAGSSLRLLIEATAGQGTNIGWRFEELAYLIEGVKDKLPIGVCLDTCHIFAAGYDIRTKKAWDATLKEFDETVGLEHLYALHLNDSLKGLGSRRDRHQPLGEGEIGLECFQVVMTHPKLKKLAKYLETPGGPTLWEKEIAMLRQFVK